MIVSIQNKDPSFSSRSFFAYFGTKIYQKKCAINFFKEHWISWRFNSQTGGHFLDFFEKISSRLTFVLSYRNLAALFFRNKATLLATLDKNCWSSICFKKSGTMRAHQWVLEREQSYWRKMDNFGKVLVLHRKRSNKDETWKFSPFWTV